MLSNLKNYLFGGSAAEETEIASEKACTNVEEDEWVLVDSKDVNSELASGGDDVELPDVLEKSWIVTRDIGMMSVSSGKSRQQRTRQPKGTKPRRLRSSQKPSPSGTSNDVDDSDSLTSSIAVIPGPGHHRPAPSASSSPVLNASQADAKQVAAIASSRLKQKTEKSWLTRRHLLHSNKTVMAASGRNTDRRCHHIAQRMCGSNSNRKTHFSKK